MLNTAVLVALPGVNLNKTDPRRVRIWDMAVVLAYGSPALGHLYPMCPLLSELVGRGHDVHLRTLSDGLATGRRLGVQTACVNPRIEDIAGEDWTAGNAFGVLKMTIDVLCHRAALEVGDLAAAIDQVHPDALIIDANCWGAMSAADAGTTPWSVFSPFTPFLQSPGTPPFGPGLAPWPGLAGRFRDAGVRAVVRRVMDGPMLPRVNAIRASVGAPEVRSVDEFFRRPPLTLVASGKPFEYPQTHWGDTVHMIGPCAFEPAPAVPDWLATIDRPIVLVTTSSIRQADTRLGLTALTALADEPVHMVVTFPAGVPDGVVAPANATVRRFVPHGAVLDRTICAVTHGGMGTTQKALSRGVPVCAVPFARDQAEVARRVEVARCGTRLPAKKLTPQRLRAKVRQAMTMADGARRVAEGFAATGGVARGAELIEQRLLGEEGAQEPDALPRRRRIRAAEPPHPFAGGHGTRR